MAEPAQRIEISADIPKVMVSPRSAGMISMQLPNLSFTLTVNAKCGEQWQPASVSISIADVRKSFAAEHLGADVTLESKLEVPADQIAPLRLERFCIAESQEDNRPDSAAETRLAIPAVLSAHASLRCATESEQSISYVTKALDVVLECSPSELTVNTAGQ